MGSIQSSEYREAFVRKWSRITGNELQLAQPFIIDLCELLGVPKPPKPGFGFEHYLENPAADRVGTPDLYKQGCFIAELKRGRESRQDPGSFAVRGEPAYDAQLEKAFNTQLRVYLHLDEDPPPLLVLIDIGYRFWIWPVFGAEVPSFRSPQRIEIPFASLAEPDCGAAELLRDCFVAPERLDLRRRRRELTEGLAKQLGALTRRLRQDHDPHSAASFMIQLVFCLFADTVGLLPDRLMARLCGDLAEDRERGDDEDAAARAFSALFEAMRTGGRFRGRELGRFGETVIRTTEALPLSAEELRLLARLGEREWQHLDPAILGTLLEAATVEGERRAHGIHYTPRAYVERLVARVLEPLELRWWAVQGEFRRACEKLGLGLGAEPHEHEHEHERSNMRELHRHIRRTLAPFYRELVELRVLDPACGAGNFLTVAYERVRAIEHEYRDLLMSLQGHEQMALELPGALVMPEQFMGIERDPWASAIAQLVLFIAHIQWTIDHSGRGPIRPEDRGRRDAVFEALHSCRRSIAAGQDALLDEHEQPRAWPRADYIVGNPPFLGNKQMRKALGDAYVEALRAAHPDSPSAVDLVMYWWQRGATLVAAGEVERMGLITTNSIRQVHNRRVVEAALSGEPPVRIAWAIADHPWIERGAAVRIAMTVVERADPRGDPPALLGTVVDEGRAPPRIRYEHVERIHADLRGDFDLARARPLRANAGVCFQGMNLVGKAGFVLDTEQVRALGFDPERPPPIIRPYLGGREFLHERRGLFVIDAYGLDEQDLRERYPSIHAHLVERVLPRRRQNARRSYRERWWMFGEPRRRLREALAGLDHCFVTCETARWRTFERVAVATVPDHQLYVVASDDPFVLGVLMSRIHRIWAEARGSRQGVGNDPRYTSSQCFASFPFPDPEPALRERVARLALAVDAGRKRLRGLDPRLTLARIHELLADGLDSRRGELDDHFTAAERSLLLRLHDDWLALENCVGRAYGFACLHAVNSEDPALAGCSGLDEEPLGIELLRALLRLNHNRRREEQAGYVRWLRPEVERGAKPKLAALPDERSVEEQRASASPGRWPKATADRLLTLQLELRASSTPLTARALARRFGTRRTSVEPMLRVLVDLGLVEERHDGYRAVVRRWTPPPERRSRFFRDQARESLPELGSA